MNYLFLSTLLFLYATCSAAALEPTSADCAENSEYRAKNPCEPVVMVVRHAEDGGENGKHYLTDSGMQHAQLYKKLFHDYVFGNSHGFGTGTEVCVCPIGKIIAIDKDSNSENKNPSSNPWETIMPLAEDLDLDIEVQSADGTPYSSGFQWHNTERLLTLLSSDHRTSTVIAWDKQGLNISEKDYPTKLQQYINSLKGVPYDKFTPLLKALPTKENLDKIPVTASRDHFYVFVKQNTTGNPATGDIAGQFSWFKLYDQQFSLDGTIWYSAPEGFLKDLPTDIRVK